MVDVFELASGIDEGNARDFSGASMQKIPSQHQTPRPYQNFCW
jgi:hypothetical protein